MAFNMNNLLKDKIVLYVVFFFAVTNLFGYILVGNLEAVIGFVLIGYVTTFYSKNMIIVMLSAMLLTNLLVAFQNNNIQEGMDHDGKEKKENKLPKKKLKKDDDDDEDVLLLDKKITKKLTNGGQEVENGVVVEKAKGGKINYAETLEEAYDNLDQMLGGEAMNRMSQDAGRLAKKQVQLMENMQQLEPLMNRASEVIGGLDFDNINNMINGFSKQLDGLGLNTKLE